MQAAKSKLNPQKLAEIDNAANEFEGMFLSEMLSHMFETTGVDPMFGGGESEETWRGMMVDEMGKQIAKSGGLGLSDPIKAEMIKLQEAADNESGIKQRT
ncbi:MAG: rod-binding protein [Alphaproteobacteria bacterium]|nr:rod-binding protein [Alphaproteobacteria bacterium]